MKISEPKIKNCELSSFSECIKNEKFNKVKIRENSSVVFDLTDYTFDECVFENIDFSNIEINDISLMDVRFINCDLSNKRFNDTFLTRVIFENCKLTGLTFIDSHLKDIKVISSVGLYLNVAETNINNIEIEDSDLTEATFNMSN